MSTIAVLQCVEKGLIDLDEDIGRILPEFADPDLLYDFDEKTDKPLIRKAKKKLTMRHLLTHSSGLGYEQIEPALMRYQQSRNIKPGSQDPTNLVGNATPLAPIHTSYRTFAYVVAIAV